MLSYLGAEPAGTRSAAGRDREGYVSGFGLSDRLKRPAKLLLDKQTTDADAGRPGLLTLDGTINV